jgi:hypothetical protein
VPLDMYVYYVLITARKPTLPYTLVYLHMFIFINVYIYIYKHINAHLVDVG